MKSFLLTLLISYTCILSLGAQPKEVQWLHAINRADGKALTNFSKAVSNSEVFFLIGVPVGMGIYDLVTKDMDHLDRTLGITASIVGTYALSLTTKEIVRRKRPYIKYPGYIIPRVDESGYSFPSNHTAGAFALATSLTLNYPKWYIIAPAYVWAAAIGYSRMQLGVHYPSDVFAGAILGAASAWGCYEAQKAWTRHRKSKIRNQGVALMAF